MKRKLKHLKVEKETAEKNREEKLKSKFTREKRHQRALAPTVANSRERELRKIATKGVCTLFNAISNQQKMHNNNSDEQTGQSILCLHIFNVFLVKISIFFHNY